ncbi:MAG TPA: EamA family transporter [Magnetospirillaceae bacterium]|nr:EamA family transporter [Magnetospirillaceae bacterium]
MPAVLAALSSILVWSTLAVLTTRTVDLPPLFSSGVALCIGGLAGIVRIRDWRIPLRTLAVGSGGIFGYHALLFLAFSLAPAVEVNLINYLWPLLIVLLSPLFLPGYALKPAHAAGVLLGLAGAFLIVGGGRLDLDLSRLPGYLSAAAAAFVWAAYSLQTKRLPPFGSGAVGLFCLVSGAFSLALWAALDPTGTLPPALASDTAISLVLLGLGPMGLAFYTWDAALKRGDPRVIGSLAYLTPLLSTLNLVVLGGKRLSSATALAMLLIIAGAVLGATAGSGAGRGGRSDPR